MISITTHLWPDGRSIAAPARVLMTRQSLFPQHRLYFSLLPHGQGPLRDGPAFVLVPTRLILGSTALLAGGRASLPNRLRSFLGGAVSDVVRLLSLDRARARA
jgi:hypothetical protein